jgi:adenylate cyclase
MTKKSSWARSPRTALAAGAFVALLVSTLTFFHAFDLFENKVWDLRVATMARPSSATPNIDIILLDQTSLDWLEKEQGISWPWPREIVSLIAEFFGKAQVKALAYDVIYDQPSTLGGDDDAFAKAIKGAGRVVLAEDLVRTSDGHSLIAHFPVEPLKSAAASLGHVLGASDRDGINRRVAPFVKLADGTRVPSLALAAWSLGTGRPASDMVDAPRILRYRGPQKTHRTFAAAQIIQAAIQLRSGDKPDIDPALFKDHYVFFGYSAQGLLDLRPSPVDPKYPGVEIHATYLDNLLAGDGMRHIGVWEYLFITVWALFFAFAVGRIRRAVLIAPMFILGAGLPAAVGWIAYGFGWWVPVVPPVLAALAAGLSMLLISYAGEGRQKRVIKNAFGQYLSPVVIERLIEDPDLLQLGGEKRCLSIFFSDVAGFTSISEKLDPVGLTSLLNDYLSEMTSIIYEHGGTIDKYEGDAIIAFWNAPLDLPDHALSAVRASLECQKRLAAINPRLQAIAGKPVTARIGLNTGDVVIGNMGSVQRFNYTFLGDAGNLASRLEGINKLFGTQFMVSQFTKESAGDAPDIHWREISRVRVVGKNLPVTVYNPVERAEAGANKAVFETFDKALQAYYDGDFKTALAGFEKNAAIDPPSSKYADRVRELIADPPSSWEGVWDAKEK